MFLELSPQIRRAQEAIDRTRPNGRLEHEAQDRAYGAMEASSDPQLQFQIVGETLERFPLSTESWSLLGYYYLKLTEPREKERGKKLSIEMFQTAIRVAGIMHPKWITNGRQTVSWYDTDCRPYLRAIQGLALAQHAANQLDDAIQTAELLGRLREHSPFYEASDSLDQGVLANITSFLSFKECARVSRINKSWQEASTRNIKTIALNPERDGADIDGMMAFLSRRCNKLESFTLCIGQRFLLGPGDSDEQNTMNVNFSGAGLNQFMRSCPLLKSMRLQFDGCCERPLRQVLIQDSGLENIGRHGSSLVDLSLLCIHFESPASLGNCLEPMVNLRKLYLGRNTFDEGVNGDGTWQSSSQITGAISGMSKLRQLVVIDHGFNDENIGQLVPILQGLYGLCIEGSFVGTSMSLSDASLHIIARHCQNLTKLEIGFNQGLSFDALMNVLKNCRLRELGGEAEDLLEPRYLERALRLCPTLKFVRYFGFGVNSYLQRVSQASGGNVIFMGTHGGPYVPTFSQDLMDSHQKAFQALKGLGGATEENGWDRWSSLVE